MSEKVVDVRNLTYVYPDGTLALKDVSIDVSQGELVVLLGPNGAGKSTLLLHLNGILKGSGSIRIFGEDIVNKKRSEVVSEVGLVFQDPDDQLFMPTVFDDVAFGPINLGLSDLEVKGRVESALKKMNMQGYESRCPHHLSLGEKKRISLASVLSMEPEILAFDEPTSNLDPKSRRDVLKVMKDLKADGKTIILATHDINAVPEISDRVYVINKTLLGGGSPREIFLDVDLLKNSNLEVPSITLLFEILSCFGYNCDELPLSIDEAISHLTETIETGGGHIHLHMHEHTHRDIKKIRRRHEHHTDEDSEETKKVLNP
ncbi:MAG: ATP-binding cassette domain-containing protein [Candidatus Altiarchaeota archaeon]|nr:ATP-binding cassette domain-containing protein [Candidatus Altiarchaeota archaeon]